MYKQTKTPIKIFFIISGLMLTGTCVAYEKGDWVVRAGLTNVSPNDSASNIFAGNSDLGVSITVDSDTQLGLNFAYFISANLNIELLAASPFTHTVNFSSSDPLGTGNTLGEVSHLPPSLTLNYFFASHNAVIQPYIGAGINYTLFFEEEFSTANSNAGLSNLNLENSTGLTVQIGVDYELNKQWHVNASARYIDIDTEARFNVGDANGEVADIEIDPAVYTLSLGYRF